MPVYFWKGTTADGKTQKGKVDLASEAAVQTYLKRRRITPAQIKEAPKSLLENIAFFKPKVTTKDIVVFTRQLSTMIDAGLPLVQCLQILGEQQDNPTFKKLLREIRSDVETGSTLADAMKKHPMVFDNLFCNMIDAGEVGGILDTILNRLSGFMEKNMALKKKVKGAMTYPVICLCISFVVMAVMLIFVVPVFETMFKGFGAALPAPTKAMVNLSDFMKKYIIHIIIAIFLVINGIKRIYRTEQGQRKIDALLLRLPILGTLLRRVAVAKFTRTLGTMLQSGVPILDSLSVVAKTAGNKVIESAVFKVADSISEGRSIAEPLEETGVFPNMVVQMINVGESTGALDTMLSKIADFYDEEVDQAVDNLTAAIEPLMMVFLGGVVGGMVVCMYLPIFSMAGAMG